MKDFYCSPWVMNGIFVRDWPNRFEDMPVYRDEIQMISRYFHMDEEFDDLYYSWQVMIRILYHEEHPYFCTVKQRDQTYITSAN